MRRAATDSPDRAVDFVAWLEQQQKGDFSTYQYRQYRALHSEARSDLWRPYRNSGENVI